MSQPSRFPTNITIEEAKEAIQSSPEFFFKEQDDVIVFNYRYCNAASFPDPEEETDPHLKRLKLIKRECRGLIFSRDTGKVISRRYHKFFNIGELTETAPELVDLNKPYLVLTKYDGTLVAPVYTNGKIRFATKSGFGDKTELLEERFLSNPDNARFYDFAKEWLDVDASPIFEYCTPRSKIVLDYDEDMLVLTGIRYNDSGLYVDYQVMVDSANKYDIPITEVEVGKIHDLEAFENELKAREGIEGVVIRFDDGLMYKVKTHWYFSKSKKDKQEYSLNSERKIWKLILEQEVDDALALTKDKVVQRKVREFSVELFNAIEKKAKELMDSVAKYIDLPKGEYVAAVRADETLDASQHIYFKLYDAEDHVDVLVQYVLSNTSTPEKLEYVRGLLYGIQYSENDHQ